MSDPTLPPDSDGPFDDPLFDAWEQSIEGPPGMEDPLVSGGEEHLDDLGRLLGDLEASIENMPPQPPSAAQPETSETPGPDVADDEVDLLDPTETDGPDAGGQAETQNPSSGVSPQGDVPEGPPLVPFPRRGACGGAGRLPGGFPAPRRALGSGAVARMPRGQRYCPETHERIDESQCDSCDKFRHWPKGSDEEPKECWYDWQARWEPPQAEDDEAEEST